MKKLFFGAIMLLAATASFIGCKKDDDASKDVTITLNNGEEQVIITPGDEKRISVQAVGYTGNDKLTYKWASSDTKVATVDKNGTVTGLTFGTTTITATTTIDKVELKGTVEVKVVSKLETLKFTQASVSYSYDQTTYKPAEVASDTFEVATVTATGEKVYGCLIPATLSLFSEGFGYDNNGTLTGPSTGYVISMPGYITYADGGMNPDLAVGGKGTLLFEKESDHYSWSVGAWKTIDEINYHYMKGGKMKDEAVYLTHVKAAVSAANVEDWTTWTSELDAAVEEGMTGGMMYEYTYYENYQSYLPTIVPGALATNVTVNIESNQDSKYMYKVNGINAEVAPLGATEIFGETLYMGVTTAADDVTGEMTVTSTKVEFGETITYHVAKDGGEESAVAARNHEHTLDIAALKAMNIKNAPALPKAIRK